MEKVCESPKATAKMRLSYFLSEISTESGCRQSGREEVVARHTLSRTILLIYIRIADSSLS